MTTMPEIKDLFADNLFTEPVDCDWSEVDWLHDDAAEMFEAARCEKCGEILLIGGDVHKNLDGDSDCDGYVPNLDGPMMNYFYPISFGNSTHNGTRIAELYDDLPLPDNCGDHDAAQAAKLLVDLPLCVVRVNGQYALALTGGGMDYSWEIAEAYIRCNQLPPVHWCDLPKMADRFSDTKKHVIECCKASLSLGVSRLNRRMNDLLETANYYAERADRYK